MPNHRIIRALELIHEESRDATGVKNDHLGEAEDALLRYLAVVKREEHLRGINRAYTRLLRGM